MSALRPGLPVLSIDQVQVGEDDALICQGQLRATSHEKAERFSRSLRPLPCSGAVYNEAEGRWQFEVRGRRLLRLCVEVDASFVLKVGRSVVSRKDLASVPRCNDFETMSVG